MSGDADEAMEARQGAADEGSTKKGDGTYGETSTGQARQGGETLMERALWERRREWER